MRPKIWIWLHIMLGEYKNETLTSTMNYINGEYEGKHLWETSRSFLMSWCYILGSLETSDYLPMLICCLGFKLFIGINIWKGRKGRSWTVILAHRELCHPVAGSFWDGCSQPKCPESGTEYGLLYSRRLWIESSQKCNINFKSLVYLR